MPITEVTAKEVKIRGCYSIKYPDPFDSDWQLSMDYNWNSNPRVKGNQWTCSESPVNIIHWTSLRWIPDHGLNALLDHFGLTREDLCLGVIFVFGQSPAALVRTRRAKEQREGLERKEIKNMRLGCDPDELLPEAFEAAA